MRLSNLIYRAAKKHKVPANIYTAILRQESAYRLSAVSKHCGILDLEVHDETCVYSDFGIAQVNYKTAKKYKMNLTRLLTDLEFSIDSGAKVLGWFRKTYAHKEIDWWTRYNCGTKPSTNRATCQEYKRVVSRWL